MERKPTVAVLCGFFIGCAETFLNVFGESAVSCYNVVGVVGCKMLNEYQVLECSIAFHTGIYEVDIADMYTYVSAVLTDAVLIAAFLMVAGVIADSAMTFMPYVLGAYLSALSTRVVFPEVFTLGCLVAVVIVVIALTIVGSFVCCATVDVAHYFVEGIAGDKNRERKREDQKDGKDL